MDWQGIEWATPVFEIAMIVVPVSAFVTLYRRTKYGVLGKSRAMLKYAFLAGIPVVVAILFFVAFVGFEEMTHLSIVSEGLARSFLLLVAFGCIVWIVSILAFGVVLVFTKTQPPSPDSRAERAP